MHPVTPAQLAQIHATHRAMIAAHQQATRDNVTLYQIPPRLSRRGGREPVRSPARASNPRGPAPALTWPETAITALITFGLLYFAEILLEAATRT